MSEAVRAVLSGIRTVKDMVAAFSDEQQCRRLLEAMVWQNGRICPACGYKKSIAIAGRDMGRRWARPGLYQCSSGDCRFQFTATTHTPLHSTKLPLSAATHARSWATAATASIASRTFTTKQHSTGGKQNSRQHLKDGTARHSPAADHRRYGRRSLGLAEGRAGGKLAAADADVQTKDAGGDCAR